MMQKYPVSRKMCSNTAAQFASYAISLNGNLSFEENWRLKCETLDVKKMYEAFRTTIVLISFKINYNCISYITQRYNKSLMLI